MQQPAIKLLARLDPVAQRKVLARCITRRYAKDEQVVRAQDKDTNVYLIRRGRVRVISFSADGRERDVSFVELGAGANFGEIAALDGYPRSTNVVALTDTELRVMPPQLLAELLAAYPQVTQALLQQLSAMVRRLSGRIIEFSTINVNSRIHAELLRLAENSLDLDGVARIQKAPTHAEFAKRVSCHREAVSREFKNLENQGILSKLDGKLVFPDIASLQHLVKQPINTNP